MIQYKILPVGFGFSDDLASLPTAFETEADVFNESGLVKWGGKLWYQSMATYTGISDGIDAIGIKEHTDRKEILTKEAEDLDYEDDITCPFCGSKESDSWDNPDSDEDFECGRCGGKFSYKRSVSVSYSMKPVKAPQVYEVDKKDG